MLGMNEHVPADKLHLLSQNLNRLMEKEGLNATSLAARLIEADPSVPEEERKNYQPTIHRILKNKSKGWPSYATLELIASYFGLVVSQLTGQLPIEEDREIQKLSDTARLLSGYKRRVLINTALTLAEPEPKQYE